jgi:putative transcriptional regulator
MSGPSHHPEEALLLTHAGGGAPAPLALVLASHVAMCGTCQATMRRLEAIGGALLADIAPEPVSDGLLAATLARLDRDMPNPGRAAHSTLLVDLPAPLRAVIGGPVDAMPWRRYGRTISETVLMGEEGGFTAALLKIRAGGGIPMHTHRGIEITLLLRGTFADGGETYRPGDLIVSDASVTHRPTATMDEDCLCLTVTEARPRFTGPLGPLLNFVARR